MTDASASEERPWGRAWEKPPRPPRDEGELTRDVPGDPFVVPRRIVAHLIDLAVAMAFGIVVAIQWLGSAAPQSWLASPDGSVAWMFLAVFLNWVVLQGMTGFSLGKAITSVRVVHADGEHPGVRAATVRTLPLLIEQWGVIGLWAISRSPRRQRFGDRWAHTYVVRASVDPLWRALATTAALVVVALCGYGFR